MFILKFFLFCVSNLIDYFCRKLILDKNHEKNLFINVYDTVVIGKCSKQKFL